MPMKSFSQRVRAFCSSDKSSREAEDKASSGLDDRDPSILTWDPSLDWPEDTAEPFVRYGSDAQDNTSDSRQSKNNHSQSVCGTIPESQPDTTIDGKLLPVPSLSGCRLEKKLHRPSGLKSQMSRDRIAVEGQRSLQDHPAGAEKLRQPQTGSSRKDGEQMQAQTRS